MFAKVRHRILDIIMNKFSENTFSVCIMNNITNFVHNDLKAGVSFHYKTPENLCRKNNESKLQFSVGAIMAVFDEISTYSTSMKDKNLRPGQSVHLSTEILKPVYAGDEVTVLTKADKLGKTIGFCTMEMLNQRGELVARGKHIRYLHMGLHFNFISHPVVLPWAVHIYERFYARKDSSRFSASGKDIFPLPQGFPSIDGVGRVFDILGLERIAYDELLVEGRGEAEGQGDSSVFTSEHGRVPAAAIRAFKMTVRPVTCNLLGNMHGGAVACAVEHACVLARTGGAAGEGGGSSGQQQAPVTPIGCYVDSVEVRYISAMKGDLLITVAEDLHLPPLSAAGKGAEGQMLAARSFGKVLNAGDGALCAEYVCSWKAL